MADVWTMGELLVEIMRPRPDMRLDVAGEFLGPFPSGAPAIFIDTVARLGHSAGIIGGVGDDDFGRCLLGRLRRDGVECPHVSVVPGQATAVAFVTYRSDGSRQFIYHIGNTPAAMSTAPDLSELGQPSFFHVMGCSLFASDAFRSEILKVVAGLAAKGTRISFDPNIRVELLGGRGLGEVVRPVMEVCAVLQPGLGELLALAGEPTVERSVARLFQNSRLELIALKRGAEGCTVFTRERSFSLGVFAVKSIDPTGAGDAFDAGLLCGILEGRALEECARLATAAAALNTAAFGPMEGDINRDSVQALMRQPLA
jgi:tagatose kinase